MTDQPVLPYGSEDEANAGFAAGVSTSEERARRADTDGTTARRQARVLQYLGDWFTHGATWKQVAEDLDLHHGQASGVLSGLHKAGKIARLTERRNRCYVYVLPEHVNGRDTQQQGRNQQTRYTQQDMARAFIEGYAHASGSSVRFAAQSRAVDLANPYTDESV